ncbi:hypothetical protein [Chitinophaga ginsengisoli]|nr:hypothetical protein [Chitinophaga ginsengisoli]
MKHLYLLLSIAFVFAACSKDDFNPSKPKDGQVVGYIAYRVQL